MGQVVVEIGMKLDKSLSYYKNMLKRNGLKLVFKCVTHDIYFTKEKSFEGLSEKQIKDSCIRIRNPKTKDNIEEKSLICDGYFKVFDTIKKDFHFQNSQMKSRIQLQLIKKIGLVVYYDNPDYYLFSENKQRELLLKELNSYGFNFTLDDLGIDKLRTLYYGKEMFSKNQNG